MAKTIFIVMLLCFCTACQDRREFTPETPAAPAARVPLPQQVVVEEKVQYFPAPAGNGQPPETCNYIHYLRFRLDTGSAAPLAAKAIVIMIPGYIGGAGSFSYLGRELVALAGTENPVEVWAIDRRSNCLEDLTGMQEAETLHNPQAAVDYYYNGSTFDNRTFTGFYQPEETPYLSEFGLRLCLQDIKAILEEKIPDQAVRKKTVFIAGHSMGATTAAAFAAWDFDDDPATLLDAGYNNCAGLIGLDGAAALWSGALSERRYKKQIDQLRAASQGQSFITPESMALMEILGLYAAFEPGAESTVFRSLAVAPATESLIEYFTTYALQRRAGRPALGDLHLSNEAMLGLFSDDNFQPLSIGRASLGFLIGGPVQRRPGLFSGRSLFVPAATDNGTFYTWANFDTIGTVADPVFTDTAGRVVLTTLDSEVTDVQDFAHILFERPLNFFEWYFPDRLPLDLAIAAAPYRTEYGISTLHLEAIDSLPKIEFLAKNLTGYNHLDVLCAAADRPQRRPNEVLEPLLEFLLAHSSGSVLVP